MPRSTWIFASLLSVLALASLGILQIYTASQGRTQAEAAAAEARLAAAEAGRQQAALNTELQAALGRVAELEEVVANAEQAQAGLERQMRTELESRDVTISELRGRLTVNILDHILFSSGEANLKPEGEAILAKVAKVLAQYPRRTVQVIGHTDTVPIRNRTTEGFTDNWALSAGRAVSAVRYLAGQEGVEPQRLSAVGCGEFHPIAPNDTAEGRARNRRIAVVVLPEDVVASDTTPEVPSDAAPEKADETSDATPEKPLEPAAETLESPPAP